MTQSPIESREPVHVAAIEGNARPTAVANGPAERQTMTITELARILGISRTTCYELAHQRKLPVRVVKVGRRMLVSKVEVRRFLEGYQPLTSSQQPPSAA